ncbi:MAG: C40 family peptidase, partial [Sphingorhabdus sp.]|nr:C40 family peptidase [Sphingorhabdus sp.]
LTGEQVPRDTDQQLKVIGSEIGDDEDLKRGDFVFFPDHVGIMVDGERIIHASTYWMQVSLEPLADVIARFSEIAEQPVLARKRLG